MIKVYDTLSACIDCLLFVANGDISEERPNIAAEITAFAPEGDLVAGDELTEFTWSACECCGYVLAGSRHEIHVLRAE